VTELPLTEGCLPVCSGGEIQLARASIEDAGPVARVHVSAWQTAYQSIFSPEYLAALSVTQRELLWRAVISYGMPEVAVATEDNTVVGFVAFGACRDESAARSAGEIWAFYVSPSHWSLGIGRRLWRYARERLAEHGYRTVKVWVLAQNARAIRFCVAAGFRRDPDQTKNRAVNGRALKEVCFVIKLRA
jgi:ribosomal protein S18 acetylase RimI-like enzyme